MSSPVAALNNIDQLFFSSSVNSSPVNYLSLYRLCLVHLLFHNHHRCITIHNPPAAIIICSPTDRPNAPNSRTHLSFASQRQLKPPFGVLRESPVACSGTSNNAFRQEIEERGSRGLGLRKSHCSQGNLRKLRKLQRAFFHSPPQLYALWAPLIKYSLAIMRKREKLLQHSAAVHSRYHQLICEKNVCSVRGR